MTEQPGNDPVTNIARRVLDLTYSEMRELAQGIQAAASLRISAARFGECLHAWAESQVEAG